MSDTHATMKAIAASVSELERAIQSTAFEVLKSSGDYELSEALLGVARDVRTIGRRVEALTNGESTRSSSPSQTTVSSMPKQGATAYPRFIVTENRIVKIGRGKSSGAKPYRHEAPREALQKLADWLHQAAASGARELAAQDAVQSLDGEVPSYQTYLMLAALRSAGVLVPTKRGSYSVAADTESTDYWSMLRATFGSDDIEEGA